MKSLTVHQLVLNVILTWPEGLSHSGLLNRLPGMSGNGTAARRWLAAIVLAHLAVSVVHGAAHARAAVELSRASTLFVFVVILAAPLVGLALTWSSAQVGGWLVAGALSASLVFGVVKHFVMDGADHVSRVRPEARTLFAATAALVAITEALGTGLAIRLALERKFVS